MANKLTFPPKDWKNRFFQSLQRVPNVAHAARYAGVSRTFVYELREQDPAFSEKWDAAIEESIGELEEVAFQRAKEQSDTLMSLLLKSHKRHVYGDKVEVAETQRVIFVDESSQAVQVVRERPQIGHETFKDD